MNELEHTKWLEEIDIENEIIQPVLTIAQALNLKENTEENQFNHFISHPDFPPYFRGKTTNSEPSTSTSSSQASSSEHFSVDYLVGKNFQETCTTYSLTSLFQIVFHVNSVTNSCNKVIEIFPGKRLNINVDLDESQQKQLIFVLKNFLKLFLGNTLICRVSIWILAPITYIYRKMSNQSDNHKDE
jgi:hypothetical protein